MSSNAIPATRMNQEIANPPAKARKVFGFSIPTGVINNLFSMYGIYFSSYLLALVTVPFLTHHLGPAAWGLVAAVQSYGGCLLLLVEFGFTFSGTREAARKREDPAALSDVLSSVQGAKAVLALTCCLISAGVAMALPLFREHSGTFWWGVLWAVLQGANLMWFFQGIEQMRLVATVDFAIRIVAVGATFALVHGPADAWMALALQAAASFVSLAVSLGMAAGIAQLRVPSRAAVSKALRGSAPTFIPRNASVLYTVGNTFMLGFFAPPEIVGFYGGADRICRAVVGLLAPASEAVYPRISHLAVKSKDAAQRLARLSAVIMTAVGLAMTAALYVMAPVAVRILLGPGYDAAVAPLRILSLLPPLMAIRNVLAIHWMLPLDLERELNAVVMACGALNIVLAILIAPHYGGTGMAWVVVISQLCASLGAWLVLRWMHLDPFGKYEPRDGEPPVTPPQAMPPTKFTAVQVGE